MTIATEALALLNDLTTGVSFDIPVIDLSASIYDVPGDETAEFYQPVTRVSIDSITNGDIGGTGAFDKFMAAGKQHLQEELENNRISGAEYTKAYIALMELAMANATQFVLSREQNFWSNQNAQIQAITARAGLAQQKITTAMAQIQANTAKAEYARAVISLSTAKVEYDIASFNLTAMLPKQAEKLTAENTLLAAQLTQTTTQTSLIGSQKTLVDAQVVNEPKRGVILDREASKLTAETTLLGTQNSKLLSDKQFVDAQIGKIDEEIAQIVAQTTLLGSQKANVDAQTLNEPKKGALLDEQVEAARGQTMNTRSDGTTPIVGILGKQRDLYTQQIVSYQRDAEVKAGKLFADAWITQKTIDEGLTAPNGFTNASLDQVLNKIKTELGM